MHGLDVDHQARQLQLFLPQPIRHRRDHLLFEDVIHGNFERHTRQRTGVAWIPFPQNGIYTSTKLTRENPEFVRRYLRAYAEAIHYYKTHKEDTIKIMRKYSRLDDRKILEEAWEWHAKFMPEAPYPPADGYQLILQDMAEKNPKAAQANVKDYIDTRFIKEMEDSGFIKNLSRK